MTFDVQQEQLQPLEAAGRKGKKNMASKRVFARMNKTPKYSTRKVNRCAISGRARGYYRKFGVSRIVLRELALQGMIPGMRKASW